MYLHLELNISKLGVQRYNAAKHMQHTSMSSPPPTDDGTTWPTSSSSFRRRRRRCRLSE